MGLHKCRDREISGVLQTALGCAHKHGGGGGGALTISVIKWIIMAACNGLSIVL